LILISPNVCAAYARTPATWSLCKAKMSAASTLFSPTCMSAKARRISPLVDMHGFQLPDKGAPGGVCTGLAPWHWIEDGAAGKLRFNEIRDLILFTPRNATIAHR